MFLLRDVKIIINVDDCMMSKQLLFYDFWVKDDFKDLSKYIFEEKKKRKENDFK